MAQTGVYISPDRVTVSKPGYDAEFPPDVDYKYLALDSRLATGRPLEVGLLPNYSFGNNVNFTQAYPGVPAVDIIAYRDFVINGIGLGALYSKSIGMRDANSSTAYNRTSFYLGIFNDHFQIVDDAVFVRSQMFSGAWMLYYIAWPVW